jgi:hypothetical protein
MVLHIMQNVLRPLEKLVIKNGFSLGKISRRSFGKGLTRFGRSSQRESLRKGKKCIGMNAPPAESQSLVVPSLGMFALRSLRTPKPKDSFLLENGFRFGMVAVNLFLSHSKKTIFNGNKDDTLGKKLWSLPGKHSGIRGVLLRLLRHARPLPPQGVGTGHKELEKPDTQDRLVVVISVHGILILGKNTIKAYSMLFMTAERI